MLRRIPTALRRLRVRKVSICPDILAIPASTEQLELLEDVIVNMSLYHLSLSDTSVRHSTYCHRDRGSFPVLLEDMSKQARELAGALKNPKIVRLIYRKYPTLRLEAFDAINRRWLRLFDPNEWDDEGREIPDPKLESEISDVNI